MLVDENIIKIPVHWVGKPQGHIFVDSSNYFAPHVKHLGTVLDYFLKSHFIGSNCVHLQVLLTLDTFHNEIGHVVSMHILEIVVPVSRQRKEGELFD
jgi:hypothetical protein